VKVAFGTDAGVFPHGDNGKEFTYMVEGGMPAMEAIKSATIVNAGILGMTDKIGTLEAGKFADLVATDENPLTNIKTMEKVSFVMKEGVVYKQ
jgi:imidazolonepropionase-like amidohydrolase